MNFITLDNAIADWNTRHQDKQLVRGDWSEAKKKGLGHTFFASYNSSKGWSLVEVNSRHPILNVISRILRFLHLAYNETRLNWDQRRKLDWINKPQGNQTNPIIDLKAYFVKAPTENHPQPISDPLLEKHKNFLSNLELHLQNPLDKAKNEALLKELNSLRNQLWASASSGNDRANDIENIKKLERAACRLVNFQYLTTSYFSIHNKALDKNGSDYFKYDGKIADKPDSLKTTLDNITIEQIPALHQGFASNNLCGYYALFFFLQKIQNRNPCDREAFKDCFKEWKKLIAIKRALAEFGKDRTKEIPFNCRYNEGPIGLNPSEIPYLLQNSALCAKAIENKNWCVVELENALALDGEAFRISPIIASNRSPQTSSNEPLPLIVKVYDHFYFFNAEMKNGKVTAYHCSHSLGYEVPGKSGCNEDDIKLLTKVIEQTFIVNKL